MITEVIKVGAGSATAKYPAACFLKNSDTLYSNGTLHDKKSRKSNALFEWLKLNCHLSSNGVLVNRSSLLQICLGLAIALDDASIILAQDSEEVFPTGTPDFIINFFWSNDQYLTIQNCIEQVHEDLVKDLELRKCVICPTTLKTKPFTYLFCSPKKRKAKPGEPSGAQVAPKKVKQQPPPPTNVCSDDEGTDTRERCIYHF